MATQLSRMVEMTSWTPRSALSAPASAPQSPPARAAAKRQAGTRSAAGRSSVRPATAAARAPQMSCPSAPILKSPTVKGTATASPVRMRTPPLRALSPSACGPQKAPSNRCANPSAASLPVARMARNERRSAATTAKKAPQSGSRDGAKSARSLRRIALLTEHHPAEDLVARTRTRFSRDPSREEDGDPVAQRAQLVEVEGDDDDRGARGRGESQRFVDAAGRGEIEPARRLRRDDQTGRRSSCELASGDELLLVPAGQDGGARDGI